MNKSTLALGLLLSQAMLWSCQPREEGEAAKHEELAANQLIDSIGVANAPIAAEPDTDALKVHELTLRALGNILEEIRYDKDTLEATAGALIKLTFVNEGTNMPMVHNVVFTVPGKYKEVARAAVEEGASGKYVPNSPAVLAASPIALPGQTVEMEFKAPMEKGYYNFVCTYPEHWSRMHGVLHVK